MRCNMTFSHVMLLALASVSHAANSIISDTILFVRLDDQNKEQHAFFGHVTPLVLASHQWQWHCQWHHCICQIKTIEMRCNMTFSVM